MKTKADTAVMQPQDKEHSTTPTHHQHLGERLGTDSGPQVTERAVPANAFTLHFQPPDLWLVPIITLSVIQLPA